MSRQADKQDAALKRESALDARTRQIFNRKIALHYAAHGIAVFPSSGDGKKTPLVKRFTILDKNITDEDRKAAEAEHKAEGRKLVHIGSTTSPAVINKMWDAYPNAVPSISTGANGLLVVDPDRKKNGPTLLLEAFEEHGGIPNAVPVTRTRDGGMHLYYKNDRDLPSSAGLLSDLGCDVKSNGAQVIAPHAWQMDGRKYTPDPNHVRLEEAWKNDAIPPTPEWLAKLIGTKPDRANISAVRERELVKQLENTEWESYEDDFDPTLGKYDLEELKRKDPKFAELYDNPGSDCSRNRMKAASRIMGKKRGWPDMALASLSVFIRNWPGAGVYVDGKPTAGEFDDRQIVREWAKNYDPYSEGEAFEAVEIEDDEDELDDATLRQREIDKRRRQEWAESARKERRREQVRGELVAEIEAYGDAQPEVDQSNGAKPESGKTQTTTRKSPTILRSVAIYDAYTPADDLIEGLLPAIGLVALVANSNVGKTFLAIEMLDCVMRGSKFLGLNTERGDVLLVAGEGREGLKKRMAALHKVRPYADGEGIALSFDLPVFDGAPVAAAVKLKRQIEEAQNQSGQPVKLVVLDNLIGMLGDGDLHSTNGTKPVLNALDALAHSMKLCIVVIHHENRTGSSAGSFAIRASVDVMIQVFEEKFGVRRIEIDKSRDGSKELKLAYKLEYVSLGVNKWGNDVGSCVVKPHGRADAPAMGAVTDDEDAPTAVSLDRREDRVQSVLDIFEQQARRDKERGGTVAAALKDVLLPSRILIERVNARRKSEGMAELGPSTVQALVKCIVDDGGLEVVGTKRLPLYKVA